MIVRTIVLVSLMSVSACEKGSYSEDRQKELDINNSVGYLENPEDVIDEYVLCVLEVESRSVYSDLNEEQYLEYRSKTRNIATTVSRLNDNNYPNVTRIGYSLSDDYDEIIFQIIPSYQNCETSKNYINKVYEDAKSSKPIILDSTYLSYANKLRGMIK